MKILNNTSSRHSLNHDDESHRSALNLSSLRKYDYPLEILDHLEKIFKVVISDEVRSIVLIGSTSRGELCYRYKNGLQILGDFEFLVITNKKIYGTKLRRIKDKLKHIEAEIAKNSRMFHIDYAFLTVSELRKLKPRFFLWETKETGIVVYGPNLMNFLPRIHKNNIDLKQLNEAMFDRLAWILFFIPEKIITKNYSEQEIEESKIILSRYVMDIPLAILVHNNYFIAGFHRRFEFLKENHKKIDRYQRIFPRDFIDFLEECLEARKNCNFQLDFIDMYHNTINSFASIYAYLCIADEMQQTVSLSNNDSFPFYNDHACRELFRDSTFKWKLWELYLLTKHIAELGIYKGSHWYFKRKISAYVSFLFAMHFSLLNYLKDNKDWEYYISYAESILPHFAFKIQKHRESSFLSRWVNLKESFYEFICEYNRYFKKTSDFWKRIYHGRQGC